MRAVRLLVGVVTLTSSLAPALRAEPPPRSTAPTGSAAHEPRRRERWERLREQAAHHPSGLPSSLPVPPPSGSASSSDLARGWAELARSRHRHRAEQRAAFEKELGPSLRDPAVRAELALHEKRLAELSRLEFLAKNARSGERRDALLARIQKLQVKELARHQRRWAKVARPSGSAAPTPSASAERGR